MTLIKNYWHIATLLDKLFTTTLILAALLQIFLFVTAPTWQQFGWVLNNTGILAGYTGLIWHFNLRTKGILTYDHTRAYYVFTRRNP